MNLYSCETHIDQALEEFVEKQETFPIMEKISDDKKLSTKCGYCDTPASYIVANG